MGGKTEPSRAVVDKTRERLQSVKIDVFVWLKRLVEIFFWASFRWIDDYLLFPSLLIASYLSMPEARFCFPPGIVFDPLCNNNQPQAELLGYLSRFFVDVPASHNGSHIIHDAHPSPN